MVAHKDLSRGNTGTEERLTTCSFLMQELTVHCSLLINEKFYEWLKFAYTFQGNNILKG